MRNSVDMTTDKDADEIDLNHNNINNSHDGSMTNSKWAAYTQVLLDRGAVQGVAIHSRSSHQTWAATPGFHVQPSEIDHILSAFTDDARMRMDGFRLEGRQFTMTRLSTNRVMMCGRDSDSGAGCVVYPCRTCVLIATHSAPQISTCYAAIEKLGDFLSSNGF